MKIGNRPPSSQPVPKPDPSRACLAGSDLTKEVGKNTFSRSMLPLIGTVYRNGLPTTDHQYKHLSTMSKNIASIVRRCHLS
jgi:hypothetical protein